MHTADLHITSHSVSVYNSHSVPTLLETGCSTNTQSSMQAVTQLTLFFVLWGALHVQNYKNHSSPVQRPAGTGSVTWLDAPGLLLC